MRILFIGDIFGSIGREMVDDYLHRIKNKHQIDFVIANCENATHGRGMNKKHYDELSFAGIDCMTMGNHTFDNRELYDYIDEANHLVVPYNQPKVLPGIGSKLFNVKGVKIRVTNCLGCVYMDYRYANPYDEIDKYLDMECDIHIIDFHGEATSEKITFAAYCSGKADAVIGTHTHVQTADERVLRDVAFISDVGMTGPYESSIGIDLDLAAARMRGLNQKFAVAQSSGQLCAVVIEFENNQAKSIQRILINDDHPFES